ncbi:NUDIX domain-containing protein [Azotobacter beijerinckii]|uniref:Phosphatase NudJ n=1 Tax=Azotobacter beijerinckii TaxID=170623 RepID=A0A1I4DYD9_9GAMM|nr:NUDIX hydrolase [Azotobacter beijerinckii]SEI59333.1 NUDIX domain-containing protein [Azotobacter beijerinckii]SEJ07281.1 NUDIX domain-containing protein [Azotobacter beijerinckii]SFB44206.1 NUDIX domain-containing protein [Azotobacter beijerinckii]SFK98612.1 NUDIX domain-containing protein [Azotobacter beijerinckii]
MDWQAHVTVATIVEDNGLFLLVEELQDGRTVLNQPAGHLEPNETLLEAALRETMEETGWQVELTAVIGIYLYTAPNSVTYQRICFAARPLRPIDGYRLDEGIIAPRWLSREELLAQRECWRSPLVLRCIDDYLAGERFPLSLIR